MLKKTVKGISLLLITFSLVISCKKKDENSSSTTISSTESEKAKTVTTDESPRSEKKVGEFESNGETVSEPESYTDATTTEKLAILSPNTATTRSFATTGLKGWVLKTVNGTDNAAKRFWIFFKRDGSYIIYSLADKNWDWGFYYINKTVTALALDPESTFEDFWKITSLSTTQLTLTTKTGLTLILEPFTLDNYEQMALTEAQFYAKIGGKTLKSAKYKIDTGLDTCEVVNNEEIIINQDNTIYKYYKGDITPFDTIYWSIQNNQLKYVSKDTTETLNIKYVTDAELLIVGINKKIFIRTIKRHNIFYNTIISNPPTNCSTANTTY